MTLEVVRDRASAAEWDGFAARRPEATLCHRHGWREVIDSVFGHECLWLEAREQGSLAGVLPLVRVKSALFGHYLVSMPFLNYGGPIGGEPAVRALADHAVGLAREGGVKLLELRSRVPLQLDLPVSHRKVTVLLDLPDAAEALMKAFPAKLRSQIRRPAKEGLEVRFGPDQLEGFYAVFARHMRDLGTPVMPKRFFAAALDAFGADAWVGCGYLQGRPATCGFGFVWGGELEMTWASTVREANRISANMGLYWAFMERAIEAGIGRFNFGRCTPGGGTHRFKQQWGGRDEQLHWYQAGGRGELAATPAPDQGAYAWGPRVWRKLPLAVANLVGPRIVRSIP